MTPSVRILREDDVRAALPMPACIDAVEASFVAYSGGSAELPDVIHLNVPEARGEIHVKAGHLHGASAYAVKVSSGFSGVDPPALDGLVMVFDGRTGAPVAFLLDGGFVTDQRTGAAGGVAARWLAPERVDVVAVIGTGVQARKQVEALRVIRTEVREIRVWGRDPERAARAASDVGGIVTATVAEAARAADVVITCTASREPILMADHVRPGAHVTALGSDGVGPLGCVRGGGKSLEQSLRLGELQHAPELADRAVELGRICAGTEPGRTDGDQLTVIDLTGVGVQDVAAANAVLANVPADAGEWFRL